MSNIKVAVRVRPLNEREDGHGSTGIVQVQSNNVSILNTKILGVPEVGDSRERIKHFAYDYCYDSMGSEELPGYASQEQVFQDLGTDILHAAFGGFNACVFAYGQTGTGKTYTMMGRQEEVGLIPRICEGLFSHVADCADEKVTCRVDISYYEIYNERVRDLLHPQQKENEKYSLKVREHPKEGPYVKDLSWHRVKENAEIQELLDRGNLYRVTAETYMHDHSSRSHAIVTISFTQARLEENLPSEIVSKIHLVDLAGSERADPSSKSDFRRRLTEGSNINKSLVTLGYVIKALAERSLLSWSTDDMGSLQNIQSSGGGETMATQSPPGPNKQKIPFIPYRDSVLTWLLKDSLGGNSKTIMIATITPASKYYNETVSTLRYAQRAKNIINKPRVNEDPNVALIRELRREIERLHSMLASAQMPQGTSISDSLFLVPLLRNLHGSAGSQSGALMAVPESDTLIAEKLQENEAMANQLTQSWMCKWASTHDIMKESDLSIRGLRNRTSSTSMGVMIDSQLPYLIGMDDDVLSTGIFIFHLKEGETLVGRDDADREQDIVLSGPTIQKEHCIIHNVGGVVTLHPCLGAQCAVQEMECREPTRLTQGDFVVLGGNQVFRFNNPTEAAKLREHRRSQGSLNTLNVSVQSFGGLSRASSYSSIAGDDPTYLSPQAQLMRSYPNLELEGRQPSEQARIAEAGRELEQLRAEYERAEEARLEKEEAMYQLHEQHRQEIDEQRSQLDRLIEENQRARYTAEQELELARESLGKEREAFQRDLDEERRRLKCLREQENQGDLAVQTDSITTSSVSMDTDSVFSGANSAETGAPERAHGRKKSVEEQLKDLDHTEFVRKMSHRETEQALSIQQEDIEDQYYQTQEQIENKVKKIQAIEQQYKEEDAVHLQEISVQLEKLKELRKHEAQLEVYMEEKQDLINVVTDRPRPLRSASSEMVLTDPGLLHADFPQKTTSLQDIQTGLRENSPFTEPINRRPVTKSAESLDSIHSVGSVETTTAAMDRTKDASDNDPTPPKKISTVAKDVTSRLYKPPEPKFKYVPKQKDVKPAPRGRGRNRGDTLVDRSSPSPLRERGSPSPLRERGSPSPLRERGSPSPLRDRPGPVRDRSGPSPLREKKHSPSPQRDVPDKKKPATKKPVETPAPKRDPKLRSKDSPLMVARAKGEKKPKVSGDMPVSKGSRSPERLGLQGNGSSRPRTPKLLQMASASSLASVPESLSEGTEDSLAHSDGLNASASSTVKKRARKGRSAAADDELRRHSAPAGEEMVDAFDKYSAEMNLALTGSPYHSELLIPQMDQTVPTVSDRFDIPADTESAPTAVSGDTGVELQKKEEEHSDTLLSPVKSQTDTVVPLESAKAGSKRESSELLEDAEIHTVLPLKKTRSEAIVDEDRETFSDDSLDLEQNPDSLNDPAPRPILGQVIVGHSADSSAFVMNKVDSDVPMSDDSLDGDTGMVEEESLSFDIVLNFGQPASLEQDTSSPAESGFKEGAKNLEVLEPEHEADETRHSDALEQRPDAVTDTEHIVVEPQSGLVQLAPVTIDLDIHLPPIEMNQISRVEDDLGKSDLDSVATGAGDSTGQLDNVLFWSEGTSDTDVGESPLHHRAPGEARDGEHTLDEINQPMDGVVERPIDRQDREASEGTEDHMAPAVEMSDVSSGSDVDIDIDFSDYKEERYRTEIIIREPTEPEFEEVSVTMDTQDMVRTKMVEDENLQSQVPDSCPDEEGRGTKDLEIAASQETQAEPTVHVEVAESSDVSDAGEPALLGQLDKQGKRYHSSLDITLDPDTNTDLEDQLSTAPSVTKVTADPTDTQGPQTTLDIHIYNTERSASPASDGEEELAQTGQETADSLPMDTSANSTSGEDKALESPDGTADLTETEQKQDVTSVVVQAVDELSTPSKPDDVEMITVIQPDITETQPELVNTETQSDLADAYTETKPNSADACTIAQPDLADVCTVTQPDLADVFTVTQPDHATETQPDQANASPVTQPELADACTVTQPDLADVCTVTQPDLSAETQPDQADASPVTQPELADACTVTQPDITDRLTTTAPDLDQEPATQPLQQSQHPLPDTENQPPEMTQAPLRDEVAGKGKTVPPKTRTLGVCTSPDLLGGGQEGPQDDNHSQCSYDSFLDPHEELQVLQEVLGQLPAKPATTTVGPQLSSARRAARQRAMIRQQQRAADSDGVSQLSDEAPASGSHSKSSSRPGSGSRRRRRPVNKNSDVPIKPVCEGSSEEYASSENDSVYSDDSLVFDEVPSERKPLENGSCVTDISPEVYAQLRNGMSYQQRPDKRGPQHSPQTSTSISEASDVGSGDTRSVGVQTFGHHHRPSHSVGTSSHTDMSEDFNFSMCSGEAVSIGRNMVMSPLSLWNSNESDSPSDRNSTSSAGVVKYVGDRDRTQDRSVTPTGLGTPRSSASSFSRVSSNLDKGPTEVWSTSASELRRLPKFSEDLSYVMETEAMSPSAASLDYTVESPSMRSVQADGHIPVFVRPSSSTPTPVSDQNRPRETSTPRLQPDRSARLSVEEHVETYYPSEDVSVSYPESQLEKVDNIDEDKPLKFEVTIHEDNTNILYNVEKTEYKTYALRSSSESPEAQTIPDTIHVNLTESVSNQSQDTTEVCHYEEVTFQAPYKEPQDDSCIVLERSFRSSCSSDKEVAFVNGQVQREVEKELQVDEEGSRMYVLPRSPPRSGDDSTRKKRGMNLQASGVVATCNYPDGVEQEAVDESLEQTYQEAQMVADESDVTSDYGTITSVEGRKGFVSFTSDSDEGEFFTSPPSISPRASHISSRVPNVCPPSAVQDWTNHMRTSHEPLQSRVLEASPQVAMVIPADGHGICSVEELSTPTVIAGRTEQTSPVQLVSHPHTSPVDEEQKGDQESGQDSDTVLSQIQAEGQELQQPQATEAMEDEVDTDSASLSTVKQLTPGEPGAHMASQETIDEMELDLPVHEEAKVDKGSNDESVDVDLEKEPELEQVVSQPAMSSPMETEPDQVGQLPVDVVNSPLYSPKSTTHRSSRASSSTDDVYLSLEKLDSSCSSEYRTPQQSPRRVDMSDSPRTMDIDIPETGENSQSPTPRESIPEPKFSPKSPSRSTVRTVSVNTEATTPIVTPVPAISHIRQLFGSANDPVQTEAVRQELEKKIARLQRHVRSLSDSAISSDFTDGDSSSVSPRASRFYDSERSFVDKRLRHPDERQVGAYRVGLSPTRVRRTIDFEAAAVDKVPFKDSGNVFDGEESEMEHPDRSDSLIDQKVPSENSERSYETPTSTDVCSPTRRHVSSRQFMPVLAPVGPFPERLVDAILAIKPYPLHRSLSLDSISTLVNMGTQLSRAARNAQSIEDVAGADGQHDSEKASLDTKPGDSSQSVLLAEAVAEAPVGAKVITIAVDSNQNVVYDVSDESDSDKDVDVIELSLTSSDSSETDEEFPRSLSPGEICMAKDSLDDSSESPESYSVGALQQMPQRQISEKSTSMSVLDDNQRKSDADRQLDVQRSFSEGNIDDFEEHDTSASSNDSITFVFMGKGDLEGNQEEMQREVDNQYEELSMDDDSEPQSGSPLYTGSGADQGEYLVSEGQSYSEEMPSAEGITDSPVDMGRQSVSPSGHQVTEFGVDDMPSDEELSRSRHEESEEICAINEGFHHIPDREETDSPSISKDTSDGLDQGFQDDDENSAPLRHRFGIDESILPIPERSMSADNLPKKVLQLKDIHRSRSTSMLDVGAVDDSVSEEGIFPPAFPYADEDDTQPLSARTMSDGNLDQVSQPTLSELATYSSNRTSSNMDSDSSSSGSFISQEEGKRSVDSSSSDEEYREELIEEYSRRYENQVPGQSENNISTQSSVSEGEIDTDLLQDEEHFREVLKTVEKFINPRPTLVDRGMSTGDETSSKFVDRGVQACLTDSETQTNESMSAESLHPDQILLPALASPFRAQSMDSFGLGAGEPKPVLSEGAKNWCTLGELMLETTQLLRRINEQLPGLERRSSISSSEESQAILKQWQEISVQTGRSLNSLQTVGLQTEDDVTEFSKPITEDKPENLASSTQVEKQFLMEPLEFSETVMSELSPGPSETISCEISVQTAEEGSSEVAVLETIEISIQTDDLQDEDAEEKGVQPKVYKSSETEPVHYKRETKMVLLSTESAENGDVVPGEDAVFVDQTHPDTEEAVPNREAEERVSPDINSTEDVSDQMEPDQRKKEDPSAPVPLAGSMDAEETPVPVQEEIKPQQQAQEHRKSPVSMATTPELEALKKEHAQLMAYLQKASEDRKARKDTIQARKQRPLESAEDETDSKSLPVSEKPKPSPVDDVTKPDDGKDASDERKSEDESGSSSSDESSSARSSPKDMVQISIQMDPTSGITVENKSYHPKDRVKDTPKENKSGSDDLDQSSESEPGPMEEHTWQLCENGINQVTEHKPESRLHKEEPIVKMERTSSNSSVASDDTTDSAEVANVMARHLDDPTESDVTRPGAFNDKMIDEDDVIDDVLSDEGDEEQLPRNSAGKSPVPMSGRNREEEEEKPAGQTEIVKPRARDTTKLPSEYLLLKNVPESAPIFLPEEETIIPKIYTRDNTVPSKVPEPKDELPEGDQLPVTEKHIVPQRKGKDESLPPKVLEDKEIVLKPKSVVPTEVSKQEKTPEYNAPEDNELPVTEEFIVPQRKGEDEESLPNLLKPGTIEQPEVKKGDSRKGKRGSVSPPVETSTSPIPTSIDDFTQATVDISDDSTQTDLDTSKEAVNPVQDQQENAEQESPEAVKSSPVSKKPTLMSEELDHLHNERVQIMELLSMNYLPTSLTVELLEAKLNYCIGQTDLLLDNLDEHYQPETEMKPPGMDQQTARDVIAKYRSDLKQSKRDIQICRERLDRSKGVGRGRPLARKKDMVKKWREADIEAFKLERMREQQDYQRSRSGTPLKGNSPQVTPRGERSRSTSPTFSPTYMTPKQHKEHLVGLRKQLVENVLADEKQHRSCSPRMSHPSPESRSRTPTGRNLGYSPKISVSLSDVMDNDDVTTYSVAPGAGPASHPPRSVLLDHLPHSTPTMAAGRGHPPPTLDTQFNAESIFSPQESEQIMREIEAIQKRTQMSAPLEETLRRSSCSSDSHRSLDSSQGISPRAPRPDRRMPTSTPVPVDMPLSLNLDSLSVDDPRSDSGHYDRPYSPYSAYAREHVVPNERPSPGGVLRGSYELYDRCTPDHSETSSVLSYDSDSHYEPRPQDRDEDKLKRLRPVRSSDIKARLGRHKR